MKKVHVVPHTHWDREWYFTTSRSKIYLMHDLEKVIDMLEAENSYDKFVLDGQASLLDDYLKWRPQDKQRIKKLVQDNKLIIGPWYTQSDQLVISGESIVRNLLYGMQICENFGKYMNVGYVPDSFGQAANMPQIFNGLGIKDAMFWRGVSDDEVKQTEFIWTGEDGTSVNVYQIPSGYYIGGAIPEDEVELKEFLHNEPFKTTWGRSSTNNVYFPNGFDQAPVRENLPILLDKMSELYKDEFVFEISDIENYIKSVKEANPKLEEISGELINGKLMRIHKTIFSSRPDLKQMNTQIQYYLVNTLEPTLTIASTLGFEYPTETVRDIWKLMFENAAHDSIGSCVSDTTNEDVYMRYKQARDIAINLVELTHRKIATSIKNNSDLTLTMFNTYDKCKAEVVEAEIYIPQKEFSILDSNGNDINYTIIDLIDQTEYILNQGNILNPSKKIYLPEKVYKARVAIEIDEINSLGYEQYTINLSGNTLDELVATQNNIIENKYYRINVEADGSLSIFDKQSKHEYKNQAILEENGDGGDSFNYSPPEKDLIIKSTDFIPKISIRESEVIDILEIEYSMRVPKNLEERSKKIVSTDFPVKVIVKLKKDSPIIDVSIECDNRNIDSHRLCILFDTDISSKFSIADQQFGLIKRPVYFEKEMNLWENNKNDWNEVPIAIETCQNFVSLSDNYRSVAVLPRGVREYEIVGDNYSSIRLTIFRTYGYMGKENLLYRPGRASGESIIETPDAQCHKEMIFDFSVVYLNGDIDSNKISNLAKSVNSPINVYQYSEFLNSRLIFTLDEVEQILPKKYSICNVSGDLTLSIIKKAENREGYIFRFYNGQLLNTVSGELDFNIPIKYAEFVNLKEEKERVLDTNDNKLKIENLSHAKIVTLYIEFK